MARTVKTPNRYEHLDNGITKLILSSPKYGEIISYIDTEDHPDISQYHLCVSCDKTNNFRVLMNYENKKNIPITRHIKRKELDANPAHQVDHRDRNTLNNTRQNLWVKPRSHNTRNRGSAKDSSSSYLGVCVNDIVSNNISYIYFRTAISLSGKSFFLLSSLDEHLCGLAYLIAVLIMYPESANITTNLTLLPEKYKDTNGTIYNDMVTKVITKLLKGGHLDKDLNPIYK